MIIVDQKMLGESIRRRRTELGLAQESFAEKCGLHRTYIGGVERGERNITINTLNIISNCLNISPAHLIKESQSNV